MLNFSMTPTAATTCTSVNGSAVPPDPDVYCGSPATQLCIKCGGEFLIGLSEPGIVHVDYVYLQPGAAGRFVRNDPLSRDIYLQRCIWAQQH